MAKKDFSADVNMNSIMGGYFQAPAPAHEAPTAPARKEKEATAEMRTTVVLPADVFIRARNAATRITQQRSKFYSLKDLFTEALTNYLDQLEK